MRDVHAPTRAEDALASALRRRGVRFKREHRFGGGYSADFYFATARLAVEVDGPQHRDVRWLAKRDLRKCELAASRGIATLRFANAAVLQDPDGVAAHIAATASRREKSRPRSPVCRPAKAIPYRR